MLVGGWPAAGKTTLSRALALELAVPYLSKDAVKESSTVDIPYLAETVRSALPDGGST